MRSVGTCNLCLYYMALLANGGFEFYVLTNGCLNQLFQVQVQESTPPAPHPGPAPRPGPGVIPCPAAGLAPPALPEDA